MLNYEEVDGIVWLTSHRNTNQSQRTTTTTMNVIDSQLKNDCNDPEQDGSDEDSDEQLCLDNEILLNDEDVWDDSLLIKMYEKSQKIISEALSKKSSNQASSGSKNPKNKEINNKENDKKPNNNVVKNNNKITNNKTTAQNYGSKKSPKPSKTAEISATPVNATKPLTIKYNWNIGDYCRLIFQEDGIEYEAKIMSINSVDGSCFVQYIGYENEEWRMLNELKLSAGDYVREMQIKMAIQDGYGQPSESSTAVDYSDENFAETRQSTAKHEQQPQQQQASVHNLDPNINMIHPKIDQSHFAGRIIPPPPTFFGIPNMDPQSSNDNNSKTVNEKDVNLVSEDDALASMLMSWYMTGYHTGYYQGQKEMKNKSSGLCSNCRQNPMPH